jgi:predicted kinase
VRECHGDLHLGNIALVDGVATAFDCIEFSDRMRWSDVMSDVGFLVMDLLAHGRRDLADRFLNRYLEESGDYAGLRVLRFFVAYRAGVRAKVAMLRALQTPDRAERAAQTAAAVRFVRVAAGASRDRRPGIIVMHGLAGSGKTTIANAATAAVGGVHLRADVERKRLFGLTRLARTASTLGSGIYSADATRRTYDRLAALAREVAESGYPAIADAAFLKRWQRDRLRALAAAAELPFIIVDCTAPIATLAERVAARAARADDASEADQAVLAHQIDTAEPLAPEERPFVVPCDTTLLRPGVLPSDVAGELTRQLQQPVTRERSAPDRSRAG